MPRDNVACADKKGTLARSRVIQWAAMLTLLTTALVGVSCGGQEPAPGAPAAPASGQASPDALGIVLRTDPDPVRTGENALEVVVTDHGKPVTDASVSTEFFMAAMPSMNMPAMRNRTDLTHQGQGVYRGTGQITMGGSWDVTVKVLRGGQEIGTKKMTITAR
jgi:hypothetical protein